MWLSVTGVPFRNGVNGPPSEGTVVVPIAGMPSCENFHASSSASELMPAAGGQRDLALAHGGGGRARHVCVHEAESQARQRSRASQLDEVVAAGPDRLGGVVGPPARRLLGLAQPRP